MIYKPGFQHVCYSRYRGGLVIDKITPTSERDIAFSLCPEYFLDHPLLGFQTTILTTTLYCDWEFGGNWICYFRPPYTWNSDNNCEK